MKKRICICLTLLFLLSCQSFQGGDSAPKPRLSLFIGMDISGSFLNSPHYDDSLNFLAHYIYSHLHGFGGLDVPNALFVGSIGGAIANEPKTFFPIQTFEGKSVDEIAAKLQEIFPKTKANPFTDYNAFFEQIAMTVRNKNLVLRPISIVMISDGLPDMGAGKGDSNYQRIQLKPLENLSRSVTLRLLYTSAVVGGKWQSKVPRRRVKIWTQDAEVMAYWKDPKILVPERPLQEQEKFHSWVKDNVDFGVRTQTVAVNTVGPPKRSRSL